jgi:uncharacterized membrane protein YciS (DUF1049 family)
MLSFQKDPGELIAEQSNDTPQGNSGAAGQAPPKGNPGGQEYLTVANRQGQLRKSTYLLAVLFVIGVACLWLMIKKSSPSAASASSSAVHQSEQTRIDQAIAKITGVHTQMFSSLESIVKKFYEFADFEQVDVKDLSKNPFRADEANAGAAGLNKLHPIVAQSEFELLTIMATEKGNCCMINDKLLYEGDSIDGLTVTEITEHSVTLANDETRIVLRLAEPY